MDFLGLRHLKASLTNAFHGLVDAFHETAFRQELVIGVVALPFAWFLPGLYLLWRVLLTVSWLCLPTMEVMNTAVENAVNILSPEKNPLAKKAKDLAGAGVLLVCLVNVIVWGSAAFQVVKYFLQKP